MTPTRRTLLARIDDLRAAVAEGRIDTVVAVGIGAEEDVVLIGGHSQTEDEWDGVVARVIEAIETGRSDGGVN